MDRATSARHFDSKRVRAQNVNRICNSIRRLSADSELQATVEIDREEGQRRMVVMSNVRGHPKLWAVEAVEMEG